MPVSGSRRRAVALVAVALGAWGTVSVTAGAPADAAESCPVSDRGAGAGLLSDVHAPVLTGDYTDPVRVLEEGAEGTSLVCIAPLDDRVQAALGYDTSSEHDGTMTALTDAGLEGPHEVVVGATDGDLYYSTTVVLDVTPFAVADAALKRATRFRDGVAVRPGRVALANPAEARVRVQVGSFARGVPDRTVGLSAGEQRVLSTDRRRWGYVVSTRSPLGHGWVIELVGQVDTATGTVRRWYPDPASGSRDTPSAAARWAD